MKRILFVLLIPVFTGCATLINRRTQQVAVYSDVDSARVQLNKRPDYFYTPAIVTLKRSDDPVLLTVEKDSLKKVFWLESHPSAAFWLGNIINMGGFSGFLIDLTNDKRFAYPRENFLSLSGSRHFITEGAKPANQDNWDYQRIVKQRRWEAPVKQQLNLKLAIPEGNLFYLNKGHGYGNTSGFLGLSVGAEYYLDSKHSLNSDVGVMLDFMIPFPAPIDYWGDHEQTVAYYWDLQYGWDLNAYHLDAGVQLNQTQYYEIDYLDEEWLDDYTEYDVTQTNWGLAFSAYRKLTDNFLLGVNYYPSVCGVEQGRFDWHYSHIMMFELIFKINRRP